MTKTPDSKMLAFRARQAARNKHAADKIREPIKTYPVEFDGKTVLVTIPENEPQRDGDKPTTTWAGGGNGPTLPEDKQQQSKKRSD